MNDISDTSQINPVWRGQIIQDRWYLENGPKEAAGLEFSYVHAWYIPIKCASLIIAHGFLSYVLTAPEITGKVLRGEVQNIACAHIGIVFYSLTACSGVLSMMTSPNGNIFRVTGPLRGEFTGNYLTSSISTVQCAVHLIQSLQIGLDIKKGDAWNNYRYLFHIQIV